MAETTATTWTCDRCGAKDQTNIGKQPVHWVSVVIVQPPRADANDSTRQHLCLRCRNLLGDFMSHKTVFGVDR